MEKMFCSSCGKELSKEAVMCPECGMNFKKKPKKASKKVVLIVVVVLAVIGFISSLGDDKETSTVSSTPKKKEPVVALTISTNELIEKYNDNVVYGDETYKGKYLKVTGDISQFTTALFDSEIPQILVSGNAFGESASLEFSKGDKTKIATLKEGDTITATCKVDGIFMGQVTLEKCKFSE